MIEIWKEITGFEGLYKISNLGRIFSMPRLNSMNRRVGNKMMKNTKMSCGHISIALSKDDKKKTYKMHILVAKHFLPPVKNKRDVVHKDKNKSNNIVSNLKWTNDSEMRNEQFKNKIRCHKGEGHPSNKLTLAQVMDIRSIQNMTYGEIAKKYGVSDTNICFIRNNKTWTDKNYIQKRIKRNGF